MRWSYCWKMILMNSQISMKTIQTTKSKLSLLFIVVGLIFTSCNNESQESISAEPLNVQSSVAQLKVIPVVHDFSGNLEAERKSNLSTRIMGEIENIYVRTGQQVNKGDLLLKIRNQDILAKKAQVEANRIEAESALASAEKDLNRFEALYANNSASDKEMDDIRTNYKMAQARVDAVKQMENEIEESLRYSEIRAPYNGVITGKFAQVGDMANPGMPLLAIENPAQWKVVARIPEADIARLKLNDPVRVYLKALDLEVEGQIAEINPSSVNTGNQFEAKILLQTDSYDTVDLYSGMYADVLYEHGTQELMLVSQNAVVHRGQLDGIYALGQNGTALLRWVKTGKTYGDSIEVLSGLTDGEEYILNYDGKLVNGALVVNQ